MKKDLNGHLMAMADLRADLDELAREEHKVDPPDPKNGYVPDEERPEVIGKIAAARVATDEAMRAVREAFTRARR